MVWWIGQILVHSCMWRREPCIRWSVKCDRAQGRVGRPLKAFHLIVSVSHAHIHTTHQHTLHTRTHTALIKDLLFNHISLSRTHRTQRASLFSSEQSNGDAVVLPFHEYDARGKKCVIDVSVIFSISISFWRHYKRNKSGKRETSLPFGQMYLNAEPNTHSLLQPVGGKVLRIPFSYFLLNAAVWNRIVVYAVGMRWWTRMACVWRLSLCVKQWVGVFLTFVPLYAASVGCPLYLLMLVTRLVSFFLNENHQQWCQTEWTYNCTYL